MNTLINLWIEPMVMNHERCQEKVYFSVVVEDKIFKLPSSQIDNYISGEKMDEIMEFADIQTNWGFGIISAKATTNKPCIKIVDAPKVAEKKKKDAKEDKRIKQVIFSKKKLEVTKKEITINDGGILDIAIPSLKVNDKIDFSKVWDMLETQFMGKIKKGDKVTLTDDDGNVLMEILGGNYLNVGISDLRVYDNKKLKKDSSFYGKGAAIKGGLFLRDNGDLEIGDINRTFYLTIHTGALLKASLKLKKSLMDLTQIKLLK